MYYCVLALLNTFTETFGLCSLILLYFLGMTWGERGREGGGTSFLHVSKLQYTQCYLPLIERSMFDAK